MTSSALIVFIFITIITLCFYLLFYKSKTQKFSYIKKKYKNLSIICIMRNNNNNNTYLALIVMLTTLIAYLILSGIVEYQTDSLVITIFLCLIVLLSIKETVFNYRVRKGLFGNNEREAREIIRFIIQNSSNIDFMDGGKPKKLISDEELEEIKEEVAGTLPGTSMA